MFNNHKLVFRNILIRAGFYSKPDFMIVGAQKAATSTLFRILARHPCILAPRNKELSFFDDGKIPFGEYNAYQMHFPLLWRKWRGKQTFEASPEYLYNRHVASRIYYYNKKTKIIVILRNPIDRAYSAWNMYANPLRAVEDKHGLKVMYDASHANIYYFIKKIVEMRFSNKIIEANSNKKKVLKMFGYRLVKNKILEQCVHRSEQHRMHDFTPLIERVQPLDEIRCVFDVGANIGQSALKYTRLFPYANIYSFEPFSEAYEILEQTITNYSRVYPFKIALSNINGELDIELNNKTYLNSLNNRTSSTDSTTTERIQLTTVDEFAKRNNIDTLIS